MKIFLCTLILLFSIQAYSQDSSDVEAVRRVVNLSEVIVRSDLNVPAFLRRIKNDSSYYKAFKNLHILGFDAFNFIQMNSRKGKVIASLESRTRQHVDQGCRTMEVLQEKVTGDFYDRNRDPNYYTAELYAAFFFTDGRICGETNVVKGTEHSIRKKRGLEKHKEQLKMMFFNPGKKIPGIPFFGNKLDVFDEKVSWLYDFFIDTADLNGQQTYVFSIQRKKDLTDWQDNDLVYDNITTWFHPKTMEIMARNYDMSYKAGIYDFDVHMEVQMTKFADYLVPQVLRYSGNWFLIGKGRERGLFTATLSGFRKGS
jgi:hypothetical protein